MSGGGVTHEGFSDESNWNTGRFRSLGIVTLPAGFEPDLEHELDTLLTGSNVSEFKWSKLRTAKDRFAALKMCDFAVRATRENRLRIDVLVWDITDSRHDLPGRDDIANLQRMYYHVFRNVLRARWPDDSVWRLYPDEHTAMDWQTVHDCLANVSQSFEIEGSLFTPGGFRARLRKEFAIEEVVPASSREHCLLQLADLFAGLSVFSREHYDLYRRGLSASNSQTALFDEGDEEPESSRSLSERCLVLQAFDEACKKHKLGVSLRSQKGLWTPNPENPLNFWFYRPQGEYDKAPRRRPT